MKKEILLLIEKNNNIYKKKRLWKKIVCFLSFIALFITMYSFILPGITLTDEKITYTFSLKDSYDYLWKEKFTKEYNLNLYYMDTEGNYIEGKDITLNIGPDNFADDPYGFGYIPINGETFRGKNLLKELNIEEYTLSNGKKYVFDHAEVYVNEIWQLFNTNSIHWDIWCQYASSDESQTDYGWRGKYGDNISYTVTDVTEYKLVYKQVRYGTDNSVNSLGSESGITFKMFNYSGNNDETGINANGLYKYFSFRDSSLDIPTNINVNTDADGFTENRAKVLPNLENGYPVFDCRGYCNNASLGYLFGASTNPKGEAPVGVTSYISTNTLLQKESINDVEYYYYDSNKNAVDYDTENNRFMLRDYLERGFSMSSYPLEIKRYEFLPFNYWNDSRSVTTISDTNFSYNYEKTEIDHWFGMTMEFSFYMPKDGTINDSDMLFSFSGDDDVWVFIDNVLVLDLGGTHGAVDGSINFKTGEVYGYLNWNDVVLNSNKTTIYESFQYAKKLDSVEWNQDKTTFDDYTLHTVKFFYLERGAAISNCKIRFNIPVLPAGTLSVKKEYVDSNIYNDKFEFALYDTTSANKVPVANTLYTIGEEEYYTDDYGKFTLKTDEVAIFKLNNYHKYYVEETNSGDHSLSYKCSLNNIECKNINKTDEFTIKPDSAHQVLFTNKLKTYNLNVSKIAYGSFDNEEFNFKIELKDNNDLPLKIPINITTTNNYEIDNDKGIITFNLKNKESIIINDIPINTLVDIKETKHDGYNVVIKTSDVILSQTDNYQFMMDSNKDITIYNTPGIVLPETGGIGILINVFIGAFLIFVSLRLLYKFKFFMKEGG